MTEQPIQIQIEGRVGVLTFNRPRVMNAFNSHLVSEVDQAMQEFMSNDRVNSIVVNGVGRCFSAGFDMKETASKNISSLEEWREVITKDFDFISQFWNAAKPTVAAAHGFCLGGGFEVLLACDLSIAGASTKLGSPEVMFGSGIVAMFAPWVTGPKQAKELCLTGNSELSAQRCYDMGILNRVAEDGKELECALDLAGQIATASASSVQMTKRAINRSYELANMKEALLQAMETEISIEADESPERATFNNIRNEQGVKAAIEWRKNLQT